MTTYNAPKWEERERDLPNMEGLTFRQIGARWGVSPSRALQIMNTMKIRGDVQERLRKMPKPLTDEWLIEDMPLTARCRNALKNEGLLTVGSVRAQTDRWMLRIPNFGRKCLREVREEIGNGVANGARDA